MKELSETLKKLDEIADQAMSEYAVASKENKDRFLSVALKAFSNRRKLLVNSGYLPNSGN